MGYKRKIFAAAVLVAGGLSLFAAQDAPAPKPLVRKDLLVLGNGVAPPPVRDIFRPRTSGVAASAARPEEDTDLVRESVGGEGDDLPALEVMQP